MKIPKLSFKPVILAASICALAGAEAKELSLIRGDLAGTGVDSDAKGVARAIFTPNNPKFRLDASGLTPNATYQFTVDGILEETLTADHRGGLHHDFRLDGTGTKLPLDFDPRGRILGLNDGTAKVLSMVFSGEGEPSDIRVDERTTLLPVDETTTDGRVELRYLEQKNKDRFIVHFHGFERGDYEFFVDGQLQAVVDLKGRSTMRTFELGKNAQANKKPGGNSKKLELDFDPRGLIVDVVQNDVILYSGEMLAQIEGINGVQVGEAVTTLTTAVGGDADATGTATVTLAPDRDLTLTIVVNALPAGDYEVLVGGVVRGTVTVTGVEPDSTGEIIFSSEPEAGELLLDFDPLGETVEIRQGTTVHLTGEISLTLTELPPPTTVETELPLLNQGLVEDASSHLTLIEEGTTLLGFEVELEGVPAGNYDLKVGDVVKGQIVVADVDGVLSGELIFNNDGSGLPLDFDPRAQVVTISQGTSVFFLRPR